MSSTWCWNWWKVDRWPFRLKCTMTSWIITVAFTITLVSDLFCLLHCVPTRGSAIAEGPCITSTLLHWINYLQFSKCTVLKYSPLQSTVSLKPRVRGHSWSFDRLHMTSYLCSIVLVTVAVSCTVFVIFISKDTVTLKSGSQFTQSPQNWYHSIVCLWFPVTIL